MIPGHVAPYQSSWIGPYWMSPGTARTGTTREAALPTPLADTHPGHTLGGSGSRAGRPVSPAWCSAALPFDSVPPHQASQASLSRRASHRTPRPQRSPCIASLMFPDESPSRAQFRVTSSLKTSAVPPRCSQGPRRAPQHSTHCVPLSLAASSLICEL